MATAAVLFAIAALGGAVMAAMRLSGKQLPPTGLAILHGVVAAAALVALIAAVTAPGIPGSATAALIGFILAALGGFIMFVGYHLKHRALPIPLMLFHAGVAVISFIVLLVGIFGA